MTKISTAETHEPSHPYLDSCNSIAERGIIDGSPERLASWARPLCTQYFMHHATAAGRQYCPNLSLSRTVVPWYAPVDNYYAGPLRDRHDTGLNLVHSISTVSDRPERGPLRLRAKQAFLCSLSSKSSHHGQYVHSIAAVLDTCAGQSCHREKVVRLERLRSAVESSLSHEFPTCLTCFFSDRPAAPARCQMCCQLSCHLRPLRTYVLLMEGMPTRVLSERLTRPNRAERRAGPCKAPCTKYSTVVHSRLQSRVKKAFGFEVYNARTGQ